MCSNHIAPTLSHFITEEWEMAEEKKLVVKWECPKCGATPEKHGKGGHDKCQYLDGPMMGGSRECGGFICECEYDCDDEDHGTNFGHPCGNAMCYHCGWSGIFPKKPKGLQAWEKKALDAGWVPPESRKKELGL